MHVGFSVKSRKAIPFPIGSLNAQDMTTIRQQDSRTSVADDAFAGGGRRRLWFFAEIKSCGRIMAFEHALIVVVGGGIGDRKWKRETMLMVAKQAIRREVI